VSSDSDEDNLDNQQEVLHYYQAPWYGNTKYQASTAKETQRCW
jgi:hypothetical protein